MKVLNTSPHHLDTPSVLQDRKMDGPNSINNYSPLTMTPKLLTLQLPMMISTTTTSHKVAHVPSDRNTVLGNNSAHGSGEIFDLPLGTVKRKQPGISAIRGRLLGYGSAGSAGVEAVENLRGREKARGKAEGKERKSAGASVK